jgi:hypothetical protein
MRFLLFLIAIGFNMYVNVVQAEEMWHVLLIGSDYGKSRPSGKPSFVTPHGWEFFGKRPSQILELSAGNCCTSIAKKISFFCSSNPTVTQCCKTCKVFSYDLESKKDNRLHFVSSINGGFKLSEPPGRSTMRLKMISEGLTHHWKKFDYYGLLSSVDKVQQMGICCIREHETQVKSCGSGGYCCAPCSVDSITGGEEVNGFNYLKE